nr:reverse transcriptase domain-containing protein [Tanacetum cinerariifolium]
HPSATRQDLIIGTSGWCHSRTAFKTPIGCIHYRLVYGKSYHLPLELEHIAFWALKHANFDLKTAGDHRKLQLNELHELRDQAYETSLIYKERTKKLHDAKIKNQIFNVGNQVLLFNSRLKIFLGNSRPIDSQMHNNIMAAGSRDRPPMLAPGRYPQWRSRFLRYVDTRPNVEALRKCILSGPYKPTTVLVHAVEETDNSPAVAEHTTVETPTNIHKGKEIAKPITPQSETASEEDSDPEQAQRDKDMQKNLALVAKYFKKLCKPTNNNLRTSSNSKNKNYDWLADMDKEVDEQELEAHYSYMAKIHEVPTADSGTDSEPVELMSFLIHPICEDDVQNEQNDVESDDERVALANLKLDVDENKKIQKKLKKANTTLAQELKECKAILAKTSKSLGESISV